MRGASAQTEARRGSATVVLESRSRDRTGLGRLNHLVGLGQVPVGQRPGHARPAPREAGRSRLLCDSVPSSSGPLLEHPFMGREPSASPFPGRLRWKPMSPFALLIALDHAKRKNRGWSPLHSPTIVYAFLGAQVKTPSRLLRCGRFRGDATTARRCRKDPRAVSGRPQAGRPRFRNAIIYMIEVNHPSRPHSPPRRLCFCQCWGHWLTPQPPGCVSSLSASPLSCPGPLPALQPAPGCT